MGRVDEGDAHAIGDVHVDIDIHFAYSMYAREIRAEKVNCRQKGTSEV